MAILNNQPPLIAHIIFRFATGGLENGLVNLINHMPSNRYRHAVICLTDATPFSGRIRRKDVPIVALHKQDGLDWKVYGRMWRVLRKLKPAIVHTRNLPTMEFQTVAWLAGVHGRIHGEHGRDMYDVDGTSVKYNMLRRLLSPFICRYTAVSRDLASWLSEVVGISPNRVSQIYNGVDVGAFCARADSRPLVGPDRFVNDSSVVIGTVGRMQEVKDQVTLAKAFIHLLTTAPEYRKTARLIMVGDGPLRRQCLDVLEDAGMSKLAWLPGDRQDVPELMRAFDVFVLPSRAEGISNTILEAMATGLPVIATNVGGNPELLLDSVSGQLVPSGNVEAMATAIAPYVNSPSRRMAHGHAGRSRVESYFSLDVMVRRYIDAYDAVLADGPRLMQQSTNCC